MGEKHRRGDIGREACPERERDIGRETWEREAERGVQIRRKDGESHRGERGIRPGMD